MTNAVQSVDPKDIDMLLPGNLLSSSSFDQAPFTAAFVTAIAAAQAPATAASPPPTAAATLPSPAAAAARPIAEATDVRGAKSNPQQPATAAAPGLGVAAADGVSTGGSFSGRAPDSGSSYRIKATAISSPPASTSGATGAAAHVQGAYWGRQLSASSPQQVAYGSAARSCRPHK